MTLILNASQLYHATSLLKSSHDTVTIKQLQDGIFAWPSDSPEESVELRPWVEASYAGQREQDQEESMLDSASMALQSYELNSVDCYNGNLTFQMQDSFVSTLMSPNVDEHMLAEAQHQDATLSCSLASTMQAPTAWSVG